MSAVQTSTGPWESGRGAGVRDHIIRLGVRFVQGLLSFMEPGTYRWHQDEEATEVVVSQDPFDREVVEKFPAVVVTLGPDSPLNFGIGNKLTENLRTGVVTYTDLLSSSFAIYCIGGSEADAVRLADVLRLAITSQRSLADRPGGFHNFAQPGVFMNPPSPPGALVTGDPTGLVMVQLSVPFHYQLTWRVTPNSDPHYREIGMFMDQAHARDFPFPEPKPLDSVQVVFSIAPTVRRRRGALFTLSPSVEVIEPGQSALQRSQLLQEK